MSVTNSVTKFVTKFVTSHKKSVTSTIEIQEVVFAVWGCLGGSLMPHADDPGKISTFRG